MSMLSIGDVAKRTGVSISALHFYERKGLIRSERDSANRRIYARSIIRQVTVIKIAQKVGISLADIAEAFNNFPEDSQITAKDWSNVSATWRDELNIRINLLTSLRDELAGCIGCGCLSIDVCPLVNKNDKLSSKGAGAHLLDSTNKQQ